METMKKLLLILASAILFTSCDKMCTEKEYQESKAYINKMKVGDVWNPTDSDIILIESNASYTVYRCIYYSRAYYVTVKENRIVSIWTSEKHYIGQ